MSVISVDVENKPHAHQETNRRFLSPVFTVSAWNAWDYDPPFGEDTREKKGKRNACIFRVSQLKQARLIRSEKRKKCETSLKLFSTKEAYSAILDKSFLAATAEGRILNHGFTKEEIPNIYKLPFKILKEPKLIMFQVKIIHSILTTQSSLFHAHVTDTDVCPLCNLESQSLKHAYYL